MLTIEMKINGTLIGQIYAHNEGYVDDDFSLCNYTYHCYLMGMKGQPKLAEGSLQHKREKGFTVLAEKLFKAVVDEGL